MRLLQCSVHGQMMIEHRRRSSCSAGHTNSTRHSEGLARIVSLQKEQLWKLSKGLSAPCRVGSIVMSETGSPDY